MSEERIKMISELKKSVVPELKTMGFNGVFPHYRRTKGNKIDLLMFQFNKWGGGFLVEISYVLIDSENRNLASEDNSTPIEKVTVPYTNIRHRLCPKNNDGWFYYYDIVEANAGGTKIYETVKPSDRQKYINDNKGVIRWIQIVDDSIYERLAKETLYYLTEAENWWGEVSQRKALTWFGKLFKNI